MKADRVVVGVNGRDIGVDAIKVDEALVVLSPGFLRRAWVYDEWYTDVKDPGAVIAALSQLPSKPDIFTFVQRVPHGEPLFPYHWEPEGWAVMPVTTFDCWWNDQIKFKARNHARKAGKSGVTIKRPQFDDEFISGMVDIFNETPIRQGRPFWHYGKDFATVKREFSRFLFRESLIGAYFEDKLIGFIMLGEAGDCAMLGQIISMVAHRNKSTNNALLAEAVRVCAEKGIPYLVYALWDERSLGAFKKSNGFERFDVPRYFVPLTLKGRLAMSLNLHRGVRALLPEKLQNRLRELRNRYYDHTHGTGPKSTSTVASES